jgi:hypothetical protein
VVCVPQTMRRPSPTPCVLQASARACRASLCCGCFSRRGVRAAPVGRSEGCAQHTHARNNNHPARSKHQHHHAARPCASHSAARPGRALLVVPTNVVKNWGDELCKWLPGQHDPDHGASHLTPSGHKIITVRGWHSRTAGFADTPRQLQLGCMLRHRVTTKGLMRTTRHESAVHAHAMVCAG